jgi:two-component system phosphate regulon sensor histidine kinase PhoR
VVIISLTTFVVSYLLTVKTEEFVETDTKQSLQDKTTFLIPILRNYANLSSTELNTRLHEISAESNTRITIIEATGNVLIETFFESVDEMDNHIGRPEVKEALASGQGSSLRFSDTIKLPMLYFARRMAHQPSGKTYFVRLGVPFSQLEERLSDIRYTLVVGACFGMLVSLLIALILARRVTEPIAAITKVADEISQGNYSARLDSLPRNELGTLGFAINHLAEAVQANISRREKMEKIRREFSSNVSHELKTPLTSINGYVETLLGGAIYDETVNVRFLEIIKANIERIITMVTDLLRLSSIEADEGTIQREPVDWRPIIKDAVNRQEINFQNKNINFDLSIPEHVPPVLGRPGAMTHILDNLLQNAVNYTPKGGTVRVELVVLAESVVLHVEDTGIGIAEQDLGRIFERFYRVDTARSRDDGGTGLGLAIVKHLVIQIQGTITVESKLKKGSKFTVTLPTANIQKAAG